MRCCMRRCSLTMEISVSRDDPVLLLRESNYSDNVAMLRITLP